MIPGKTQHTPLEQILEPIFSKTWGALLSFGNISSSSFNRRAARRFVYTLSSLSRNPALKSALGGKGVFFRVVQSLSLYTVSIVGTPSQERWGLESGLIGMSRTY